MRDEHLDNIPATESDEVIKSSVEDLVPIPSESEGISDTIDDDSLYNENIEYVEASSHDSELVSLEVAEIVIPEDEEIEDDNLREKLLNVNLLIAKIEAVKDNPTSSSKFLTKSSSTSPKSFLEETNTFDNSLSEFENFCFDLEEISSGSITTHSDISLPDFSLSEYDSFIFDLSNDQFPPTDRSDFTHEEFADELAHIISSPEYDCFYLGIYPIQDYPDFEVFRALSFSFTRASHPQLHFGNPISKSYRLTKRILKKKTKTRQKTIKPNTEWKRSEKTKLFEAKSQKSKPEVSDQKDNTHDTSANTKFAKKPIVENLPKVGETNALSKPVTSNSVSTPQESKGVNNDKVIAPGMFRINPFKTSREEKHVPNTVNEIARTKPITVSQLHVFTKKDVNSDLNGLSSTRVDNTKTRRPQPRSNTKYDRVVISKVVCAMCKKCLISVNHDECLRNYVNGKNTHGQKQKAKVSFKENQKKYQPKITKRKKVGILERLATPKPKKPRFLLRWSPTGRLFDQEGNIVDSSESESQSDCSKGDNACTSNTMEPKIKRFPNSTSLL
nr:hypothetical protein [Tanacetum cinerariifolium]